MSLLTDKLKSERGYSGAGRLMNRVLHALSGTYVVYSPFTNADERTASGMVSVNEMLTSLSSSYLYPRICSQ